jgi:hypothetical protein
VTRPASINAGAKACADRDWAQDQEQIKDVGDLVVKAYTQWGKQPAKTAEWKQRVAADRVRLAALQP